MPKICITLFVSVFCCCIQVCQGQSELPILRRGTSDQLFFNQGDSLSLVKEGNQNVQSVIMLFHAEEDTIGLDPGLSTRGRFRAFNLQKIFAKIPFAGFYTTPFRNNILTLQPLMDAQKKEAVYYDQADIAALVKKIDYLYPAHVMVMVHPPTLHKVIQQLGGPPNAFSASGFLSDKILVLKRDRSGIAKLHVMSYTVR